MNRSAAIVDVEHLRLEPLAVALIARHEDVGEKLHLDAHLALALTRFAAAAGDVEREMARAQAARPRILGRGEQLTDRIERLQIRDGIRPRRAPDRRLIDQHGVGDVLGAFEIVEDADALVPPALGALDGGVEHVVDERRLARPADAGHHGQRVERDADVDVLQVVFARADQLDLLPGSAPSRGRHRNREFLTEVLRGQRARLEHQRVERPREHDAAALLAGAETEIDDVIGDLDHVGVVFDHQHRVALIAELTQDGDEAKVVARMQADRRLVEHVRACRPAPSRATSPG